ncbi:MAG: tRNA (guanine(10)-N(2))-dimethyltransferase, partial [Candidatus Bathyarchaeia archaeon]|nr:tRNA (guanine(10)-N(2))-dimethyltransferase [Candidatus Bathyarchaeia archaeon]
LTATDMAPLCGVYPKACIRKYGGKPLRTEYCHELAVRLLAGCLAVTAAKYDIGISILFSHSTNHYIRIYAKIAYGAKKADESIKNMGYILHCFNCFHRETLKTSFLMTHSGKCSQCNSKLDYAGPLWLGKIFDKNFCENMEKETQHMILRGKAKVLKILALIKGEVDGSPTYYVINKLCDKLAIPVPSVRKILKALREGGFQASLTHFNSNGVRTNVSATEIVEFLKSCVTREHDKF